MTRRQLLGLATMSVVVLRKTPSAAFGVGSIVLDPTNLVENTLTAARALVSNQQEARMILQNLEQLAQDAKHLISIPLSLVNQISEYMRQYQDILKEGRGLTGEMQWGVKEFEDLFRSGWNGNSSLMQQAQAMLGKVREAGRLATRSGMMYDRLGAQQQTVNRLLITSQAAPGSLAAQQATNQLLGTLASQQGNLQLLQAAQNEMETSWIMSQVVSSERASADAQQQMIDVNKYRAATASDLAKGPRLPQ